MVGRLSTKFTKSIKPIRNTTKPLENRCDVCYAIIELL